MKLRFFFQVLIIYSLFSCKSNTNNYSQEIWRKYQLDTPENFVLTEFNNHDIIFLGETHRKKNDLIFLQQLIPKLYNRGVYLLFYEFASHDDNETIDSINCLCV